MTAIEIIEKLYDLGAEIRVNGDRLKIHAPTGAVTPEFKSVIAERKPEIIELLASFLEFEEVSRVVH